MNVNLFQNIPSYLFNHEYEKSLCEKDFHEFVKAAWNHIDPDPYIDNWHIECLCKHLQATYEDRFEILDVTVPPGHAKSMLCSVLFPAWLWIKDPSLRLLTGSHSMDFAIRDTRKSRDLITCEWYQGYWGDKFTFKADQNLKKNYSNDQGGYRIAISTTGTTGARGDVIIFDDAMSVTQAESEKERETINIYMSQTLFNRQNIMRKTKIIILGQRVHHKDYHTFFLSLSNCFHLDLQMEFEPDNAFKSDLYSDPRTKLGEILFDIPKFQGKNLEILKIAMGKRGWATQYQQRPSVQEGEILKRANWGWYKKEDLPVYGKIVSAWDFAAKTGEQNDFTVCITAKKVGNKFYIVGFYRKRVEYPQAKRDYIAECDKFKPVKRYVEDASNGVALIAEMSKSPYEAHAVSPGGRDKVSRVNAISPIQESGSVLLPYGEPWTELFIEECANFPNGEHDDSVDSLAILLNNERLELTPSFGFVNIR